MKVKIGKYPSWISPYYISEAIFFWTENYTFDEKLEERWDYKLKDKFCDWLAKTWVKDFCNWYNNKFRNRKIKVHVDNYDLWSADHTLSLIIAPVLKKLKEVKHGSPDVDDEDVPDELKSTAAPKPEKEWDTDANFHKRWDWVLDEMIWAFDQHNDENAEDQFHSGNHDIMWQKVDLEGNTIGEPEPVGFDRKPLPEEEKNKVMYTMVKGPNDTHVYDKEGHKAWSDRKHNGFRLFGKYYTALWD